MCGFVISVSRSHDSADFPAAGRSIYCRGPDKVTVTDFSVCGYSVHIEFSHLFITLPKVEQPLQSDRYILVFNGEVYNSKQLAEKVGLLAGQENDVQVFFQHVLLFGLEETLPCINGMYAGVLIDKDTGSFLAFTDHVGKKPLLLWYEQDILHIGTGLDEVNVGPNTSEFHVLTPGLYEIDIDKQKPYLLQRHTQVIENNLQLSESLFEAVSSRIPDNLPFAVALSGGLDSSVLSYIIEKQLRLKPEYFIVGEQLPATLEDLIRHLGIERCRINLIKPSSYKSLENLLIDTCKVVKSYNPSIISNGIATMMLSEAVHESGFRVLLSGEGADEFFCGYQAMYNGKYDAEEMRRSLISDLHYTELRRLDLVCSHHAIEARCPFLDKRVTSYALSLDASKHCSSEKNLGKMLIRNEYRSLLPDSIINAGKEPFDITSGLQKTVIALLKERHNSEREALKTIFYDEFKYCSIFEDKYFSWYPVFDEMIDQRERKYSTSLEN